MEAQQHSGSETLQNNKEKDRGGKLCTAHRTKQTRAGATPNETRSVPQWVLSPEFGNRGWRADDSRSSFRWGPPRPSWKGGKDTALPSKKTQLVSRPCVGAIKRESERIPGSPARHPVVRCVLGRLPATYGTYYRPQGLAYRSPRSQERTRTRRRWGTITHSSKVSRCRC